MFLPYLLRPRVIFIAACVSHAGKPGGACRRDMTCAMDCGRSYNSGGNFSRSRRNESMLLDAAILMEKIMFGDARNIYGNISCRLLQFSYLPHAWA